MIKTLYLAVLTLLSSFTASAAVFTCNLQRIPPIGAPLEFIKVFTFDTTDVPAETMVGDHDLKLTLYSDGKHIQMTVANSTHASVSTISSYESELTAQIDDVALGVCLTEDVTRRAIPLGSSL